jgi:RNA polymerase sigma-70 factor (ECF subfamily)
MVQDVVLAERFEEHRSHLQAVAYRMLGSLSEAEDAVQEAWFRLSRSDLSAVENLGGWLTRVVGRISLDMLRSRRSRREDALDAEDSAPVASRDSRSDPEQEAVLADSVGLALLVVLNTLTPTERVAFVLHDMFAVPFEEIAPIVERTPEATRQLASRARRRVRGAPTVSSTELDHQRGIVDSFLAAARAGDLAALVGILDPDIVLTTDRTTIRGAQTVANLATRSGAVAARRALVNGTAGVVIAPRGRLLMVLTFTVEDGRVVAMDQITNRERLEQLELALLEDDL